MSVFRVEKAKGYTVMSNHHLRNHALSLKAKGLLSQMLSLPEDWDYTLQGLAQINKESIDAIREAVRELERAGYIERSRERDERGCLRGTVYTIYEQPHAEPTPEEPTQEKPALDMQLTHWLYVFQACISTPASPACKFEQCSGGWLHEQAARQREIQTVHRYP